MYIVWLSFLYPPSSSSPPPFPHLFSSSSPSPPLLPLSPLFSSDVASSQPANIHCEGEDVGGDGKVTVESFTQPSTFDEIVLGTQVPCTPGASQVCVCVCVRACTYMYVCVCARVCCFLSLTACNMIVQEEEITTCSVYMRMLFLCSRKTSNVFIYNVHVHVCFQAE